MKSGDLKVRFEIAIQKLLIEGNAEDARRWFDAACDLAKGPTECEYFASRLAELGDDDRKVVFEKGAWMFSVLSDMGSTFLEIGEGVSSGIKLLKIAAEGGVSEAQCIYGSILINPETVADTSVEQNIPEGVSWMKKSAEQAYGMAEYNLAALHIRGAGVEKNFAKAKEYCERALEHGSLSPEMEEDAKAVLEKLKGGCAEDGTAASGMNPNATDSEKEEFKVLLKSASDGDVDSQYCLGVAFALGRRGAVGDRSRAAEWYEKAANSGKVEAIVSLADCYKDGVVANKGLVDAIALYEKAAEQGDWRAQHLLAEIFSSNDLGVVDYAKAVKWALLAADNEGTADVLCLLGRCFENGLGIEKNITEAIKYYQRAAQKDNEEAKSALERLGGAEGDTLYGQVKFGPGVTDQDKVACRKIYSEALAGSVGAEYEMGNILSKGMYGILIDKKEAFGWYLKAAEGGHAYAQYEVASWYSRGIKDVVDWNDNAAFKWYWESACQLLPEAMRKVADCFCYGSGVKEDEECAKWWCVRAAKAGDADAIAWLQDHWKMDEQGLHSAYQLASDMPAGMNLKAKESDKAQFRELYAKASSGDADAQYKLGRAFVYGDHGARTNEFHGIQWLRKASGKGCQEADYLIGDCYYHGWGVDEDCDEALVWYKRAADAGHADAAEQVGSLRRKGKEVAKDLSEAYHYYRIGAAACLDECQFWVGEFLTKGLGGVEKNESEGFVWYEKSALQGNTDAICALGWAYQLGRGTQQDYGKAVEWFTKGSEKDDGFCQNNLARLVEDGKGVTRDLALARSLFELAVGNGCSRANYHLGRFYENGLGVEIDIEKAKEYYAKVADKDKDAKAALERLS